MADLTITASDVVSDGTGIKETANAGAAISAGQIVFKDTNGVFQLSDANDPALDEVSGLALNAAATGQPVTVAKIGSNVTLGSVLSPGTPYYLSSNPGMISPFADVVTGDRAIFLGIARSATVLHFRPIDSEAILA